MECFGDDLRARFLEYDRVLQYGPEQIVTLLNPIIPFVILIIRENSIHFLLPVVDHLVAIEQLIDTGCVRDTDPPPL